MIKSATNGANRCAARRPPPTAPAPYCQCPLCGFPTGANAPEWGERVEVRTLWIDIAKKSKLQLVKKNTSMLKVRGNLCEANNASRGSRLDRTNGYYYTFCTRRCQGAGLDRRKRPEPMAATSTE